MKSEKYLIVNADDYGRTPGVSRGIRKAHRDGVVTSTTALMNMPGIEEELHTALREAPDLGLGVHLVLTSGSPLLAPSAVDSITGGRKNFPVLEDLIRDLHAIDPEQAAAEWEAQIRRFISVAGRNPDHLDSHHHVSYFSEPLFEQFLKLAQRYASAIRIPLPCPSGHCDGLPREFCPAAQDFVPRLTVKYGAKKPDWFIGTFYDEQATREQLASIIDRLPSGISEIMCHPGYADPPLLEGSAYNKPREREIEILTTDSIRQMVAKHGIKLIDFASLE
ncbi:MAG: ChbG/HpnK family deacetylase [Anaerolineales bacterium]|nr:ChbG/HpnK family deacetylase [Anaerolineales bacterium]